MATTNILAHTMEDQMVLNLLDALAGRPQQVVVTVPPILIQTRQEVAIYIHRVLHELAYRIRSSLMIEHPFAVHHALHDLNRLQRHLSDVETSLFTVPELDMIYSWIDVIADTIFSSNPFEEHARRTILDSFGAIQHLAENPTLMFL